MLESLASGVCLVAAYRVPGSASDVVGNPGPEGDWIGIWDMLSVPARKPSIFGASAAPIAERFRLAGEREPFYWATSSLIGCAEQNVPSRYARA